MFSAVGPAPVLIHVSVCPSVSAFLLYTNFNYFRMDQNMLMKFLKNVKVVMINSWIGSLTYLTMT